MWDSSVFEQPGYRVRLEWGPDGVAALAPVCAVVIIVDVLSFSTAVDVAVGRGASVLPLPVDETAVPPVHETAVPPGTIVAGRRGCGSWSLSPASLLDLPAGTRLALPSPNGATLSAAAASVPGTVVLAGCLRNAPAVAAAAVALSANSTPRGFDHARAPRASSSRTRDADGVIGVVPAGERWPDGRLRPAVEDLLGAGAVIAGLDAGAVAAGLGASAVVAGLGAGAVAAGLGAGAVVSGLGAGSCSPEALAAADAFHAAHRRGLAAALDGCASGRELAAAGFGADVALAAEYGVSSTAPVLRDGEYVRAEHGPPADAADTP